MNISKLTTLCRFSKRQFGTAAAVKSVSVLQIPYQKLVQEDSDSMLEIIEKAYSENGLGTLAISGVPGYIQYRRRALIHAYLLANLPQEAREKLERPEHFF